MVSQFFLPNDQFRKHEGICGLPFVFPSMLKMTLLDPDQASGVSSHYLDYPLCRRETLIKKGQRFFGHS